MELTGQAAREEKRPGAGGERPEGAVDFTEAELDRAFSDAITQVDREHGEIKVGHLKVERVAAERGGALLPDEAKENDDIVDAAATVVDEQKKTLGEWGDLDMAPAQPVQSADAKGWGELDMSDVPETAAAAAAALALSKARLEGKDVVPSVQEGNEDKNTIDVDVDEVAFDASEDPRDMTSAEIAAASALLEQGLSERSESAAFDLATAKTNVENARAAVADAKADLARYKDTGIIHKWSKKGKEELQTLNAALETANAELKEARAEYVGADAMRMLEDRMEQSKAQAAALSKEKGLLNTGFERAHEIYKKLGKYDASWATGFTPQNRVGRAMMRAVSARSIVSAGLLAGGLAVGATSAVGIGAIFARRALSGVGGAAGSYDLMRMAADRSLDAFKPSAAEVEKMDDLSMLEKMEKMEARAMLEGKPVDGNAVYLQLKEAFGQRLDAKLSTVESDDEKQALLELFANKAEADVAAKMQSRGRKESAMRIAAIGVGAFIGSGQMARMFGEATRWAFDTDAGKAVAETAGRAAKGAKELISSAPAAEAAANAAIADMPSPVEAAAVVTAGPDLTEIHKGDGYVKIFARQMEGDPAKFGYDAAKDGSDAHKWAMKMGNKIAKEQGLMGKGFTFNAENPGHVTLNPDHTFTVEDTKQIYARAPRVAAAPDVAADAVSERVPSDTLSHVETYVDADGTPYYQHDWKQFKFDAGIPENVREEVARSIDAHGREIQAMTGMMEDARATYGREPWFNKFDLMMQKQIRGSYVDWRHEMRQAAGVDKGVMYVNEAVPGGNPKEAAKAVFEATRVAGGFPAMDIDQPSAISKAIDAVTGTTEAVASIESIQVGSGLEVTFLHDASGNVTGYEMNGTGSANVEAPLLRKDFMSVMAESGHALPIEVTQVQFASARIEMARQTYEAMRGDGKATTPEAKFMLKVVRNGMALLEKKYPGVTIRS